MVFFFPFAFYMSNQENEKKTYFFLLFKQLHFSLFFLSLTSFVLSFSYQTEPKSVPNMLIDFLGFP